MGEPPAKRSKSSHGEEEEEEMKIRAFIGKLKEVYYPYYAFQSYNMFNPRNRPTWADVAGVFAREFAEYKDVGVPVKGGDLGLVKHYSHDMILAMTNNFCDENYIQDSLYGRQFRGKLTNRDVIVKIWDFNFPLSPFYGDVPSSFSHQLELLLNPDVASHPNMAKLIGYSCETILALVWDLRLTTSLHSLIPDQGCFNWEQRVKVAGQVADALKFFHEKKIALCNFFSPCISVDEGFNVKLFEFDRSVNIANEYPPLEKGSWGGYPHYYSPELVQPYEFKTEWLYASDVYHFGLLLLELTMSKCVENEASFLIEQAKEVFGKDNSNSPIEPQMTQIFVLAMKCVQLKPESRPKMDAVVDEFKSIVSVS